MNAERQVTVLTHSRKEQVAHVLELLIAAAHGAGVRLRFDPEGTATLGLETIADDVVIANAEIIDDVELCIVLGGDGTILRGLRRYARTDVPVFAVNYGEVGFLAALEPEDLEHYGFERAFAHDFDVLLMPAITIEAGDGPLLAINDVSIHRKIGARVARLAYGVEGEEVGRVRCDGLVVCTPAGSTGYNLANGGPVMAWGVEGFCVSFIAPHSLTARAVVVAPSDCLSLANCGSDAVEVLIDGRPAGEIAPGAEIRARFEDDIAGLAQVPGWSFYGRLRTKFGRLSS
ncbi:MAG: NAD(+)/NADH kinase [Actinomycetota bacterium]|nr:NAD(+)/NADH kinase [Actinomycetota bacterium]